MCFTVIGRSRINDNAAIKITGDLLLNKDLSSFTTMEVYHGGYEEIQLPEIRPGKFIKDFGEGFYCTYIKEQAIRWASRYHTPVVSIYECKLTTELNICEHTSLTEEWLDFIVACRNGTPHQYDVITGAMANDQIYNYVSDYINGTITREQFWILAKFKYPTHQICFCSEKALACLKYKGSHKIADYEW